jgi:predicted nucleic acid-binding protein
MLNLDTHVLLHAVAGRPSPAELRLLENDQWSISAIVLWEIAKLAQLGRIAVDLDDAEVVRALGIPDTAENEAGFGRVATRWESTGGFGNGDMASQSPT